MKSAARVHGIGTAIVLVCLSWFGLPLVRAQQAAGGGPPGQVQVALEGTAALSGVVTDATTGQPIPGVMVYLGFQGRGAVGRLSRQISDEKGRFVFTDLAAGANYFINASKFGYLEGHYGTGAGGLLGGLITLKDGQWFSDAKIVMQRPGSISGTVVDEHGEPAVGVFVRVLTRINAAGRVRLASGQTTKTDDRGAYHLPDLLPGRYVVQVPFVQQTFAAGLSNAELAGLSRAQQAQGRPVADAPLAMDIGNDMRLVVGGFLPPPSPVNGRPQTYPSIFHPGVFTIAAAMQIDLAAGEDRRSIDIALHAVPATAISGVVEGPPEVLLGTPVRLIADGLEELGAGSETATATLGADGRFVFANIPAGSYTIDVRRNIADLYVRATLGTIAVPLPVLPGTTSGGSGGVTSGQYGSNYNIRSSGNTGAYFAQQKIAVDARPIVDLSVPLRRGSTIRGKFVMNAGETAADSPGTGYVFAEPADNTPGLGTLLSLQPPPSPFTFEIPGLTGGLYLLRFGSLPYAGTVMSVVADDGIDHRFKPFDSSSGRDFDVTVTITNKRIDLSGIATDAKGAQVANAIVIAFPVERDQWIAYGFSPVRLRGTPLTNSGTYRFQSLPAGDYYVIGVPPDQGDVWQDPAKLSVLAPQAARVSLAWGDTKVQNVTVVRIK